MSLPSSLLFFVAKDVISLWQDEAVIRKSIANFSQVWNEFIYSMRVEDLISNGY